MLKDNLVMLRKLKGCSQEQIAETIGISRQAYAKWEKGEAEPGVDKAVRLARFYGVTLDILVRTKDMKGIAVIPAAQKGKKIRGRVTAGGCGQAVIPGAARERLGMKDGDRLIVGSEEAGITLIPAEVFERKLQEYMDRSRDEA